MFYCTDNFLYEKRVKERPVPKLFSFDIYRLLFSFNDDTRLFFLSLYVFLAGLSKSLFLIPRGGTRILTMKNLLSFPPLHDLQNRENK